MNPIDMDTELDGHTERDADAELGVDAATATALRHRLAALAAEANVPADGWDRLTARTGGTAGRRRGSTRWRRRLVAAAAVLLVLVGSTVTHGPDDGRTDVETDDTPSTTVDRDVRRFDRDTDRDLDDRERATADDDRTSEEDGARGASDATPGASDAPSPGPADAGAGESAGSATASGLGGPGSGSTAGSTAGGSTSSPRAPATTTSPATTTTVPPPPPRLPGDITVTTSSGFAVELVLDAAPSRISAVVRRTDSRYDGSHGMVSDGYTFSSGVVLVGENPTLGGRCLRAGAVDSRGFVPHHFAVGLTGSDIAGVRLRMADGTIVTGQMTQRSVANGVRAYLAEVPSPNVVGVDGVDVAGELVVSVAPPHNYACG